jgi:hypothetical protein
VGPQVHQRAPLLVTNQWCFVHVAVVSQWVEYERGDLGTRRRDTPVGSVATRSLPGTDELTNAAGRTMTQSSLLLRMSSSYLSLSR